MLDKTCKTELTLIEKAKFGDSASFELLFRQYSPIVIHIKEKYFLRGYELDDWLQEGRIVFFNTIANYDSKRHITVGKFFQANFQNRVCSLIRREMAFKRRSDLFSNSLEAMQEENNEYERLFMTKHGGPHEMAVLKENCERYYSDLSVFEARVFRYFFSGKSSTEIASLLGCESSKVLNAISRCRNKFEQRISHNQ
ncbi:sigma-70 family RNA polymerase sigma factor [Pediococcus ethanolidurans]|uniref:sigma-70 family RNA polymerase sigma factor n=1 Tax=Pediococcus ethanolidurans TaxID=319653 RepID=UPI001C1EF3A6|nr:sigma-70 family RNA polymerase sigma factor [Pediococcus ethanolidurans]MBU7554378.1 sigma-70 family RNA polymerase sigma factor [Pediococcus ethanolidurans]MBU7563036.1 sigma-70 family RNA polymerase sigma factor [Pediococcus ethanolidurans]MCT4398493.1 sigma-70 family RNA polymerase sigma factor [Pediococcus ethanolidurans]MCV3316107.1 sigma-70 family RNA polymerase sigma factor [Pediococcus ethanolidurans]MCV3321244.1 sigma-70 family RNA polymerase sigma factor [Pediococcus ethanoliduran